MIRRFVNSILALTLALTCVLPLGQDAFAKTGTNHDKDTIEVLFGKKRPVNENDVKALTNAIYLCLDYSESEGNKAKGERCLRELDNYGVNNLPAELSEINTKSGGNHRKYTHIEWDEQDDGTCSKRHSILKQTTYEIFDYSPGLSILPWIPNKKEQYDSFSALVYYTHIVGDYQEDSDLKTLNRDNRGEMIPLAIPNANENKPDVFYELSSHLENLFSNSRAEGYSQLMLDLSVLANDTRDLTNSSGEIAEKDYEQFKENIDYLMVLLKGGEFNGKKRDNTVHDLLENEGLLDPFYH